MSTSRRTPTRRPGKPASRTIDLDAIAAEETKEPFVVTWQGRDWEFTHMDLLDTWELTDESHEELTQNELMLTLFEMALGEEQYAEFRQSPLPIGLLQRMFSEYNAYCGVSLGESRRSGSS